MTESKEPNINFPAKKLPITSSTPSIPQYFTWINNNNEGSTEKQTLINLDFFGWMLKKYGMHLEIYAFDAGNFDDPGDGYVLSLDSNKKNFPHGFAKVAEHAAKYGIRLGVWGGPDGYGDTKEQAEARKEVLVSLCRDYNFHLFKFDGVCGQLKKENAKYFADTMDTCRKYCPDLILLNHRLDLQGYEDRATTSLWRGEECYIDVMISNKVTALHHRVCTISRDLTDNLSRMYEDHGVCLSSCMDYWDDDLIAQSFGRCLIVAPEMYGSPWLLRDDEFPKLADIYNLHYKNREILINGLELDTNIYGSGSVSRGNGSHRFLMMKNMTWKSKNIDIPFNSEIGLDNADAFYVTMHHPYKTFMGKFCEKDRLTVTVEPFRVLLLEISSDKPDNFESLTPALPKYHTEPLYLGKMLSSEVPYDAAVIYESTPFTATNNALEYTTRMRAGETAFPEVKAARDAFFDQTTYRTHGCEDTFLFDGRDDTFFDGFSRSFKTRIEGGALRIDCGETITADRFFIDVFVASEEAINNGIGFFKPLIPQSGCVSDSLFGITFAPKNLELLSKTSLGSTDKLYINQDSEAAIPVHGEMIRLEYSIDCESLRFLRLPEPPDRIYSVKFTSKGKEVKLASPRATNLFADRSERLPEKVLSMKIAPSDFTLNGNIVPGSKICIALEGHYPNESIYCAAKQGDKYIGSFDRAPSYPINFWSWTIANSDLNNTCYISLDKVDTTQPIEIYALMYGDNIKLDAAEVYIAY